MVEENPRTLDWAVAGINFLPWVLNYSSPVRFVQRSSWAKIPQILPSPDPGEGHGTLGTIYGTVEVTKPVLSDPASQV